MKNTIVDAMRDAIRSQMKKDPNVFVIGEDVGVGGTFYLTVGLQKEFGKDRIIDTPISEAGFTGLSIGAAIAGMRPIVDFQYGDFVIPAAEQIIQSACKFHHMSGGQVRVPIVIHAPTGAGGRGAQHTTQIENTFFGTPGLIIGVPSTAYDAKGMLNTAIRCNNPVMICVHKHLYGAKDRELEIGQGVISEVPQEDYEIPLGKGIIRRKGKDITIVSASLMTHRSISASELLMKNGIDAEIIDLRWLTPMDFDLVIESVVKTGRLLVVEEGPRHGGWSATVAAYVAEYGLSYLDSPILRVAGADIPLPFGPLEKNFVPQVQTIYDAAVKLVKG